MKQIPLARIAKIILPQEENSVPSYARKHQLQGSLMYHVYNRSNRRTPIFHEEEDYIYFKQILSRYKKRFAAKIYHWVIMDNHFHFLLELEEPEQLSKMMGGIAQAYTYYYHKKYATAGYLWQGRFKLQPVESGNYLLSCGRYIERNPLEAGIVKMATEYLYSSARYYCQGSDDFLTDASPAYREFGSDQRTSRQEYQAFLKNFHPEEDEAFSQMENPIGQQLFIERLKKSQGRYMPRRRGRSRRIVLEVTERHAVS